MLLTGLLMQVAGVLLVEVSMVMRRRLLRLADRRNAVRTDQIG